MYIIISGMGTYQRNSNADTFSSAGDGFIFQWQTAVTDSLSEFVIQYPISFPHVCFGVQCQNTGDARNTTSGTSMMYIQTWNVTTTSFYIYGYGANTEGIKRRHVFATGY